jgi:ribosomal protein S6-L-glutamate ligase RimK-like protein
MNILILYDNDDWNLTQPNYSERQQFSYSHWGEYCNSQKINLYRASCQWFNGKKFLKVWKYYENGTWKKTDNENINPNVVYDKCIDYDKKSGVLKLEIYKLILQINQKFKTLNSTHFNNLVLSKLNQAVIFKKYLPKTNLLFPGTIIKNKNRDKIVLKKIRGSGGYQVLITDEKIIKIDDLCLKQEFIDFKKDNSLKDFRIVFLGNKPIYAFSRTAKKNSLYTNLHQGGKIEFINIEDIKKLLDYSQDIISLLKIFDKKIFSLDFVYDNQNKKYFLLEVNSKPGLDAFDQNSKPLLIKYLTELTKYLLD